MIMHTQYQQTWFSRWWAQLKRLARRLTDALFPPSEHERAFRELTDADLTDLYAAESPADFIHPLFQYRHESVRSLVWLIKYHQHRHASKFAAQLLYEHLLDLHQERALFDNAQKLVLVPIPSSKTSQRERGYNQAEELARHVNQQTDEWLEVNTTDLLKVRHTPKQTSLSRDKRLVNVSGSFGVRRENDLSGAHVVLLDDVTTTGATLTEAKRTIKRAKPASVTAITLAH